MHEDRKKHWENIYQTKQPGQVSWTQEIPTTSLEMIEACNLSKNAKIIDIGGGDSLLADHLLDLGYTNISVLDISASAIARAKKRLGERESKVNWIVSDITDFSPEEVYDCWHDRAAFHFLTNENDVKQYRKIATQAIQPKGSLIIGTFSDEGPQKCSGIEIKQYTESSLEIHFQESFTREECIRTEHKTPFDTFQSFVFCRFNKNN